MHPVRAPESISKIVVRSLPGDGHAGRPSLDASLRGSVRWAELAYEVVRRDLKANSFIEPASIDPPKMTRELHGVRVTLVRGVEGGVHQSVADPPAAVLLVHHQRVDRDHVSRPMKLAPRRNGDQASDTTIKLSHDNLGRWLGRQFGRRGVRGDRPAQLAEQPTDARPIRRLSSSQPHDVTPGSKVNNPSQFPMRTSRRRIATHARLRPSLDRSDVP